MTNVYLELGKKVIAGKGFKPGTFTVVQRIAATRRRISVHRTGRAPAT